MGTSQGLTLKKTPQWSSAKRAMTGLLNDLENDAKLENFMLKFYQTLGSDGIYIGTTTSGSSSGGSSTRGSGGGGSSSRDSRGVGQKDVVHLEELELLQQRICWASFLTFETMACRKP